MTTMLPHRVWFYHPQLHWYGWKTLIPVFFGSNEFGWRTVVLGWTVTGRVVIALNRDTSTALDDLHGWLKP